MLSCFLNLLRAAVTEHHRLGSLHRNLSLTLLGPEQSLEALADSVSVVSSRGRGEGALWDEFYRNTNIQSVQVLTSFLGILKTFHYTFFSNIYLLGLVLKILLGD